MNSAETAKVLTVLSGAYPATEVTEETAMLWDSVFASDPYELVAVAVRDWITNEEWWPTPAGIRSRIRSLRHRADMEEQRAIEPGGRIVPAPEGIRIAYASYERFVRARPANHPSGNEPRPFAEFCSRLGAVGEAK